MDPEVEERLITLETKLAYQEDTLLKLQELVLAQQKQLYRMEQERQFFKDQFQALRESGGGSQLIPNEKPPHY